MKVVIGWWVVVVSFIVFFVVEWGDLF